MTNLGGQSCPECGSRMVPTLKGLKCPKMAACGRGGIEERGSPAPAREVTGAKGKAIRASRVPGDGAPA